MDNLRISVELSGRLRYNFRNLALLFEALTQDFDADTGSHWDLGYGNVFYPKRNFARLETLGRSVLKSVASEFVVNEVVDFEVEEKYFGDQLERWISEEKLTELGRGLKLHKFIQVATFSENVERLFPAVICALFGAVYVDAGEFELLESDQPLHFTRKLFAHLWKLEFEDLPKYGSHLLPEKLLQLNYSTEEILQLKELQRKLGYNFETIGFLERALLQDAKDLPLFRFLGRGVYELVICTYLFWFHINDHSAQKFNPGAVQKFVKKEFKTALASGIGLEDNLPKDVAVDVNIVRFFEGVIGAIWVDSEGIHPVKNVVVHLCRQFSLNTARSAEAVLPYSIKTYYGSLFHIADVQMEPSEEDFKKMPEKQAIFRIRNLDKFYEDGCWNKVLGSHTDFLDTAQHLESQDFLNCRVSTLDEINQLEFRRMNIYRTVERISHNKALFCDKDGNLTSQDHSYGNATSRKERSFGKRDEPLWDRVLVVLLGVLIVIWRLTKILFYVLFVVFILILLQFAIFLYNHNPPKTREFPN